MSEPQEQMRFVDLARDAGLLPAMTRTGHRARPVDVNPAHWIYRAMLVRFRGVDDQTLMTKSEFIAMSTAVASVLVR